MNETTIFDPRFLGNNGIDVYGLIARPGSFVLTAERKTTLGSTAVSTLGRKQILQTAFGYLSSALRFSLPERLTDLYVYRGNSCYSTKRRRSGMIEVRWGS